METGPESGLYIGMSNRQALRNLKKAGVNKETRKQLKEFLKQDNKKIDNPLELALLQSIKDGKGQGAVQTSFATPQKTDANQWGWTDNGGYASKYKYEDGGQAFVNTQRNGYVQATYDNLSYSNGEEHKGSIYVDQDGNLSYQDSGTKGGIFGNSFNREFNINLNQVKKD
ncbi:hypothetical protein IJ579_07040 [bacterium]|nr:hypothetical protein [bacterium]